jgi:hypothetical protein
MNWKIWKQVRWEVVVLNNHFASTKFFFNKKLQYKKFAIKSLFVIIKIEKRIPNFEEFGMLL